MGLVYRYKVISTVVDVYGQTKEKYVYRYKVISTVVDEKDYRTLTNTSIDIK